MAAKPAAAAYPCSYCQDFYDTCIADGNTPTYCQANLPSGCSVYCTGFSNTAQKMQKPDESSLRSALLAMVSKESLQPGK
ncbi:hypothetical protein GCM10027285_25850 [Oleiagrimonas citrea]